MIQFLREIFLPTRFKNYFLFSIDFVGITITQNTIYNVKVNAAGNNRTIKEVATQPINEPLKIGKYNELIFALEDTNVIFKSLTVPFIDPQKIEDILPFEVESLIPFSKEEAAIEFIQTKINTEENSSDIVVAIIQKSLLDTALAPLKNIGVMPDRITVQAFLLSQVYTYTNIIVDNIHIVTYVERESITLLIFVNKQLKFIRVLSYGLYSFARQIAKETNESFDTIMQNFSKKHISLDSNSETQYKDALKKLKTDLTFTLQPFISNKKTISLSIVETENEMPFFVSLLTNELGYKSVPISQNTILDALSMHDTQKLINNQNVISLYAALPLIELSHVDFMAETISPAQNKLFIKQIITMIIIIFTIIILLFLSYRNSTHVLQNEIKASENEVIQILRTKFDVPAEERTLDDVIDYSENEVKNQEKTWLAFSNQARASVLQYLLELTERINKDALGFVLERLSFEQNKIIMKAEVRDYEALKILERELRQSPLFTYVEPQDNPRFTMTINLLPLGEQE